MSRVVNIEWIDDKPKRELPPVKETGLELIPATYGDVADVLTEQNRQVNAKAKSQQQALAKRKAHHQKKLEVELAQIEIQQFTGLLMAELFGVPRADWNSAQCKLYKSIESSFKKYQKEKSHG